MSSQRFEPLNRLLALVVLMLAPAVACGCSSPRKYSQTELVALTTRDVDLPPDAAFDAVVHTMLDARYQIVTSDRRGGNLSGIRAAYHPSVFAPPHQSQTLSVRVDGDVSTNRSTVRVNTLVNNEAVLDEGAVKEFFDLLERRQTKLEPAGGGS